jgi:hypothetical protein
MTFPLENSEGSYRLLNFEHTRFVRWTLNAFVANARFDQTLSMRAANNRSELDPRRFLATTFSLLVTAGFFS